MAAPITPPPEGTVFTKDPVLVTTALFVLLQGLWSILLIAQVLSDTVGGILAGLTTVAWTAVQLLFVRPATVPRQPLAELAYETQVQHPTGSSSTTVVTPTMNTGETP